MADLVPRLCLLLQSWLISLRGYILPCSILCVHAFISLSLIVFLYQQGIDFCYSILLSVFFSFLSLFPFHLFLSLSSLNRTDYCLPSPLLHNKQSMPSVVGDPTSRSFSLSLSINPSSPPIRFKPLHHQLKWSLHRFSPTLLRVVFSCAFLILPSYVLCLRFFEKPLWIYIHSKKHLYLIFSYISHERKVHRQYLQSALISRSVQLISGMFFRSVLENLLSYLDSFRNFGL